MKSKIGKLYNVLVIGGSPRRLRLHEGRGQEGGTSKEPTGFKPRRRRAPIRRRFWPAEGPTTNNANTDRGRRPAGDRSGPRLWTTKTKKTVKKGDKAGRWFSGFGLGKVKGWSWTWTMPRGRGARRVGGHIRAGARAVGRRIVFRRLAERNGSGRARRRGS